MSFAAQYQQIAFALPGQVWPGTTDTVPGPNLPPLPGQVWPGTTDTFPGALDDSAYELLERALSDLGDPHPDQLRELSVRAPEIDPDDFVADFKRLGPREAKGGDTDAEEVE